MRLQNQTRFSNADEAERGHGSSQASTSNLCHSNEVTHSSTYLTSNIPLVTTTPASPPLIHGTADADLPLSMSRRRRAMNKPILQSQMRLPPVSLAILPVSSPSKISPNSSMALPSSTWPGVLNHRPNLIRRGSSVESAPHTPVDQIFHAPMYPPEIPKGPSALPRRRGDLNMVWNDRWNAEPDELFTPFPGKTFELDVSLPSHFKKSYITSPSSGSSGNTTPSLSSSSERDTPPTADPFVSHGSPIWSIGSACTVNPVVRHRLNPRSRPPAIPRRLSYQQHELREPSGSLLPPPPGALGSTSISRSNIRISPTPAPSAGTPLASPLVIKPMSFSQTVGGALSSPIATNEGTSLQSNPYFNTTLHTGN
jgi:hypothetical protein